MSFLKKLYGRKANPSSSEPEISIFYNCNSCFGYIESGALRYNCVDCPKSYDLCVGCHTSGKADEHTREMGSHHTFVTETRSCASISSLVHKGSTLEQIILDMFRYYNARPAIGQYDKIQNNFVYLTFQNVFEMVKDFGSGLAKLMSDGNCNQMVSMSSVPRLEWYVTDLACLLLGVPTVPLDSYSNMKQMSFILRKAGVSVVICSSTVLKELVKTLPECPTVQVVILMDAALNCTEGSELCGTDMPDSVRLMKFTEVMILGKQVPRDLFKTKHKPTDLYTVQFTSGSTGEPKGCVFTRNSWKNRIDKGVYVGYLRVWLSFHPPSHNLERGSFYTTLLSGGKIGIHRGSMEHLFDDFALVQPTVVASTPRLWTVLYDKYLQALHKAYIHSQHEEVLEKSSDAKEEGISRTDKQSSFSSSGKSLEHFDPNAVPAELRMEVIGKFKSMLGGRERLVITGGAPTGKLVKRFIIECFDGMINEGYGSTEVGGIATDGSVHSSTEVKLRDVPEMGYFTTDKPPRGEICVKNSTMIGGYFKSPEATAEKFLDGYFLTGDIGVMDENGKLRIIDRKKNIFKLAQGEFVSPERLGTLYVSESYLINQMYIYGNSLQSNILAVVVPERERVFEIVKSQDDKEEFDELCKLPIVKEAYMKEIQSIAMANSLPGWEVPADILLEPLPFSVENGLLTSTLKTNRPKLEQKYKSSLEEVYSKLNNSSINRPLEVVVFEIIQRCLGSLKECTKEDHEMIQKSFSQLGGDSLSAMHLSSLLMEHLSLEIPVGNLVKKPLEVIIADISSANETSPVAPNIHNWESEASIDSLLLNDYKCASPVDYSKRSSSSVLLTGCTGFLGQFILWELLQDTRIVKVFCLVQSKEGISSRDRVVKILNQLCSEMECSHISGEDKLVVMDGDLTKPMLGLSMENHTTLCEEVDTIIHNGATVNFVLPYSALKQCNVESTKQLIRMAITTRPKFVHYISTIGVYSPTTSQINESSSPSIERLNSLSGYLQSKWVAESLVLTAIQQGKIWGNISRPGLIGPHSVTGHANVQDWVCWLMRGLVKLGLVPIGPGCEGKRIYWVPVEQVARAIVYISTDHKDWECGEEKENIFHLVNSSTPIRFSALTDALMSSHPTIKTTRYEEFRWELKDKSKISGDQVLGSLDLLLPKKGGWPNSPIYYSESHKVAKLEQANIHLGKLHDGYVQSYVEHINKELGLL